MANGNNPVFRSQTFQDQLKAGLGANTMASPSAEQLEGMYNQQPQAPAYAGRRMSLNDVLNKTLILFAGVLVGGFLGWGLLTNPNLRGMAMVILFGSIIGALVVGLINQLRAHTSPTLSIVYAVLQGLVLGAISGLVETLYPGIVVQAVMGTFIVFGVTLALYRSGKYRTSRKWDKIVGVAMIAYALFGLINVGFMMLAGFSLREGWIGLAIGAVAILLATYCLVSDFEMTQDAVESGAPVAFAWTCAFGLTVTLLWLYMEILRVLWIIRSMVSD